MATLRRRKRGNGEHWYLYWWESGRQRSQSLGPTTDTTEAQARVALAAKQIEVGQRRVTEPEPPRFHEWAEQYLMWHEREYPSSHYRVAQIVRQWLLPVFGDLPLDSIKRASVEAYKLERQAAPGTIAKELRVLQAVMNKAVDWEVLTRNPIKGVRPPQDLDDTPPRYLTRTELARLYDAAAHRADWWRLMVNTGLRRGEALGLRWDAVQGPVLLVLSTSRARTKAGKSRAVPLNNAALAALDALKGGDYVLPRMYPRSLSRCFEVDAERAGLTATLHDLRHTFCAQLVLAGVALRQVQLLAGHSTSRVTERYTRLVVEDLRADVGRLEL